MKNCIGVSGYTYFLTILLISILYGCTVHDEQIVQPPCVPGWRDYPGICDDMFGCGQYYEDCGQVNSYQGLVYSFGKKNIFSQNGDMWTIGDTILVRVYFQGKGDESFDSVDGEMCDGIFDFNISYEEVITGWSKEFIIGENQKPGIHTIKFNSWKHGQLVNETLVDKQIFPKLNMPTVCVNKDKVTIIVHTSANTPTDAKIQIRKYGSGDWPFEQDSSYYLNKIDDFRYCISIDFRADESYYFLRDGDESKCAVNSSGTECAYFINNPQFNFLVWPLSWADSDSLPQVEGVCE